jgi:hypothetical protein
MVHKNIPTIGIVRSYRAVLAVAFAWALAAWVPVPALSLIGALPLVFWFPGAAALRLTRAIQFRRNTESSIERRSNGLPGPRHLDDSPAGVYDIAVSTALSAAVAIAVGLMLAFVSGGVPRVEVATVLAILALGLNLLADRVSPGYGYPRSTALGRDGTARLARWIVPNVVVCCFLVALLGFLSWRLYTTPAPGASFTALGLETQNSRTIIQVINHESTPMSYRLEILTDNRLAIDRAFQLQAGGEYKLTLPTITAKRETARLMTEPNNKLYRTLVF